MPRDRKSCQPDAHVGRAGAGLFGHADGTRAGWCLSCPRPELQRGRGREMGWSLEMVRFSIRTAAHLMGHDSQPTAYGAGIGCCYRVRRECKSVEK